VCQVITDAAWPTVIQARVRDRQSVQFLALDTAYSVHYVYVLYDTIAVVGIKNYDMWKFRGREHEVDSNLEFD